MDRFRALTGVFLLLFLAGCATTPKDGGIDVSVVNVSPGPSTPLETTLIFTIRYQNSMPETVIIKGSSHKIFFEGVFAGEALSNEELPVPAFGSSTQEVTAHLQNIALATTVMTIVNQQAIKYELRSTFYGKRGNLSMRFTQTKSDNLDLNALSPGER